MRKVVFLIFPLFALCFLFAWPVLAQEATGSATFEVQDTTKSIQYDLPYPGILPDSPLWPLKDLRDKVVGLFIFDPVMKGQYDLKLADKKLAMAQVLRDNGQKELGDKVLGWAAEDYNHAVDKAEEAKVKKLDFSALASRLSLFAAKYADTPELAKPVERIKNLFIQEVTNQ